VTKYLDFSGSDIYSNCTFHCGFSGPIWVVPLSGSALSIGNTLAKKKHGFVKSGSRKSGIFGGNLPAFPFFKGDEFLPFFEGLIPPEV